MSLVLLGPLIVTIHRRNLVQQQNKFKLNIGQSDYFIFIFFIQPGPVIFTADLLFPVAILNF